MGMADHILLTEVSISAACRVGRHGRSVMGRRWSSAYKLPHAAGTRTRIGDALNKQEAKNRIVTLAGRHSTDGPGAKSAEEVLACAEGGGRALTANECECAAARARRRRRTTVTITNRGAK
ncbi:unnamed protein product, partial [Iphiclides podalirius]